MFLSGKKSSDCRECGDPILHQGLVREKELKSLLIPSWVVKNSVSSEGKYCICGEYRNVVKFHVFAW